jgi:virulence factor Mce-like protein
MTPTSSRGPGGAARALIRRPWIAISAAVAVAFILWVLSTRSEPHHVRVALPSALSLVPGLDVQVDGVDAGKISKVDYRDGRAVVELGIDGDHWPLHAGTTARVRYGTTVGNGTRRVDIEPGPASAPALADGGIIPARQAYPPVEIDQVFNTLDRRTRRHLQGTVQRAADGLSGHAAALNRGIGQSAKGLTATGALIQDLAADTGAMRGLVVNAHRTTRVLAARRAAVADLVTVAASTFDEFGSRSAAVRAALSRLPGTLSEVRGTLRRLDASVGGLQPLFVDLRPGAASLRSLAPVARAAVTRLRRVAPTGTGALEALRAAAPDVRALLAEAPPVVQRLTPTLAQLAPMLACVRPYAPEAAGTLSNWASYTKNYDGISHYARVKVTASPYSLNSTPDVTTESYMKLLPMLSYALPRPPGLNAGTPWFLPECGAGPDSLDPAKDPEDTARPGGPRPTRGPAAAAGGTVPPSGGGTASPPAPAPAAQRPSVRGILGKLGDLAPIVKGLGR